MGMPITVEMVEKGATFSKTEIQAALEEVYAYFVHVEEQFSFFKDTSEVSTINKGLLTPEQYSEEMKEILRLSEQTKQESNGYFDVYDKNGKFNPSGLVKGWAIYNAAKMLQQFFHRCWW